MGQINVYVMASNELDKLDLAAGDAMMFRPTDRPTKTM